MADMKPVVDIDINYIFYHLHETAKEMADAVSPRLEVLNTAVDPKAKTFSPSEADIICQLREKNMMDLDAVNADGKALEEFKQECFKSLQKYCEFFFGKKILDKPLESGGKLKDLKSMAAVDKLVPEYLNVANESVDWRKPLIENLFSEADDGSPSIDEDPPEGEPESSGEENAEPAKPQTKVKGYKFQYDSQIAGQKKTDYANAIAKFSKKVGGILGKAFMAIAGDTIKDFKSGSVKVGFHDVKTGEIASKALGAARSVVKNLTKDIFTGIDKDEFAQSLMRTFVKKYPETDVGDVKAFPSDVMKQELLKQKKLDSYLQKALDDKDIRWPIKIVVKHSAPGYAKINQEFVSGVISETFKTDQKVKQRINGITNGLKNMGSTLGKIGWKWTGGKWVAGKAKAAVGAVKDKAHEVGKGIEKVSNAVSQKANKLTERENFDSYFRNMVFLSEDSGDQQPSIELEDEVQQTQEKADKALKVLQGEPDAVMKGLFLVKDVDSTSSKDSIQDRIVKSSLSKYIEKLNSKQSAKKEVAESYDNPVVGSLIATLFEDDAPSDGTPSLGSEGGSGDTGGSAGPEGGSAGSSGGSSSGDSPSAKIVAALTDGKIKKGEWVSALNGIFAESTENDPELDVKKLNLTKPAEGGKTQLIEDRKALAAYLVQLLNGKDPKQAIERFLGQSSADVKAMAELSRRIDALSLVILDARNAAEEESGKGESDWYVYCSPYLKDKSDKDKE